ncbi:hypothetical protein [Adhaeribacter aquaticus]|uniref:hypothetical protein n=1 Tax=Adhaeribacter aquaticus TaxID=299567 RepID=UPI00040DA6D8|nr:hypothetical protein [Adhaeribacter aquaticus]
MKGLMIVFLLFPFLTFAQKQEYKGLQNFPANRFGKVIYQGFIETPGVNKMEFLNRARTWAANAAGEGNEETETGIFMAKDTTEVNKKKYSFFITLTYQQEKIQYKLTDINYLLYDNKFAPPILVPIEDEATSITIGKKFRDRRFQKLNEAFRTYLKELEAAIAKN